MNDQKIDIDGTEEEIITQFRDKWHKTYEVIEKALPKNVNNQEIEALIMFVFDVYQVIEPEDIVARAKNAAEGWMQTLNDNPSEGDEIH